jgi:protein TonB
MKISLYFTDMKTNFLSLLLVIFSVLVTNAQDNSNGVTKDTTGVFSKVDKDSEFEGGLQGWKRFLETNLDQGNATGDMKGGRKGLKFRAVARFIIHTDGSVANVAVVTDVPKSVRKEVIRVIELSSGYWIAAEVNGEKVKSYRQQPITFIVPPDQP